MARVSNLLRRAVVRGAAIVGAPLGLAVVPRGPESSLPDIQSLKRRAGWRAPRTLAGVAGTDLAAQLAFIDRHMSPAFPEAVAARKLYDEAAQVSGDLGGGFGVVEADLLYAIICRGRPQRIVMAGSWISAAIIQIAIADMARGSEGQAYAPEITCLDPVPRPYLNKLAAAGSIRLVTQRPQDAPRDLHTALQAGDVLFIDSSHTLGPDSEVNYLVLEVLPRLNRGVLVHFHGINFPYDYGRRQLSGSPVYAGEGALLQAFLCGNPDWRIVACLSLLHYGAGDALKERFPRYEPAHNEDGLHAGGSGQFPNSLWIERVG